MQDAEVIGGGGIKKYMTPAKLTSVQTSQWRFSSLGLNYTLTRTSTKELTGSFLGRTTG